eukprot:COSAG01_NODE_465_length_16611_cov_51.622335_3_plen_246_part_01
MCGEMKEAECGGAQRRQHQRQKLRGRAPESTGRVGRHQHRVRGHPATGGLLLVVTGLLLWRLGVAPSPVADTGLAPSLTSTPRNLTRRQLQTCQCGACLSVCRCGNANSAAACISCCGGSSTSRRRSSSSSYSRRRSSSSSYCASGCPPSYITDGECDSACNTSACGYDGGDCSTSSSSSRRRSSSSSYCASGCPPSWITDGACDSACNNAACGYDGGDCSTSSSSSRRRSSSSSYCASGCPPSWI